MPTAVSGWSRILLPVCVSASLAACGGGHSGTSAAVQADSTPPTVTSSSPASSGSIAADATVNVTFSEALDESSVSASTFAVSDGNNTVSGSFSFSGNTVTFTPDSPLANGSVYTVTLTTGIRDQAGNPLSTMNSWSFTTTWTRQYGSSANEYVAGIAIDASGNHYVTGYTYGSLGSNANQGGADVFLAKYSASGALQWAQQLGSSADDVAANLAIDQSSGNVYITGHTRGTLGTASSGGYDYFLAKYDSNGNQTWLQQNGSALIEIAYGISVDSNGDIYITGTTLGALFSANQGGSDIYAVKYSAAGTITWSVQLGTANNDVAYAIAVDSNRDVYLAGNIGVEGYNTDARLYKLNNTGTALVWQKTDLSTAADEKILGMTIDNSDNIYVTGLSHGALTGSNAGSSDCFVAKYDASGNRQWLTQSGTASYDIGLALINSGGNLYLTGATGGNLVSSAYAGGNDVFVEKIDASNGVVSWLRQFGSIANDDPAGLDLDSSGNLYIAGATQTGLDGNAHSGGGDLFLVKYDGSGNRL